MRLSKVSLRAVPWLESCSQAPSSRCESPSHFHVSGFEFIAGSPFLRFDKARFNCNTVNTRGTQPPFSTSRACRSSFRVLKAGPGRPSAPPSLQSALQAAVRPAPRRAAEEVLQVEEGVRGPAQRGESLGGALARDLAPLSPRGVPDWLEAASGSKAVLEGARLPARGSAVAFVGPNGGSIASHAVAWRCSRFGLWGEDVMRIQDGVRVLAASFSAAGARSQDRH